jgi:hypothetical protein
MAHLRSKGILPSVRSRGKRTLAHRAVGRPATPGIAAEAFVIALMSRPSGFANNNR